MSWFVFWLCSFERENTVWVMMLFSITLYMFQKIMPSLDHNLSLGHRKRRKIKFTFYSHNIWTLDFLPYDYGIVFNHTYRIYQWWLLASTVPFDLHERIDDIFIFNMVVLKRPKKPPITSALNAIPGLGNQI